MRRCAACVSQNFLRYRRPYLPKNKSWGLRCGFDCTASQQPSHLCVTPFFFDFDFFFGAYVGLVFHSSNKRQGLVGECTEFSLGRTATAWLARR